MWWQNTIGTLQIVWICFKASTFSSSLFANVMSSKSSSKEILFSPNLQKSLVDFLCKFETLDLLTRTQAQPKGQTLFIQILSMDNRLLKSQPNSFLWYKVPSNLAIKTKKWKLTKNIKYMYFNVNLFWTYREPAQFKCIHKCRKCNPCMKIQIFMISIKLTFKFTFEKFAPKEKPRRSSGFLFM